NVGVAFGVGGKAGAFSYQVTGVWDVDNEEWREMALALYRDIGGRPVADFDPAIAEALKSIDFRQPLPDLWGQFESLGRLPLMLIR
ncbi:hypothetical protein ACC717_37510, partial [Rhizobium ruizarguesonis]